MIDPRTAKKSNADIDELAHVAIRRDGNADRVIDGEDVDELVCIYIDFSGSMSRTLEGNTAVARKTVPDRDLRRRVVGDTQQFEYA
jgi:sorbitol-specific phosphotransferase system component IIA